MWAKNIVVLFRRLMHSRVEKMEANRYTRVYMYVCAIVQKQNIIDNMQVAKYGIMNWLDYTS